MPKLPTMQLRISQRILLLSATIADGWATGDSFPFNGVAGFIPNNVLANPGIKPESLLSREIGLELKLFKNRLNFDLTYYNNQNRDLLISVPVTGSTGYNCPIQECSNNGKQRDRNPGKCGSCCQSRISTGQSH